MIYTTTVQLAENLGDDPCVTNNSVCTICSSFTEKQRNNIHNRSRYVRKQKTVADTSKDEADLLGDFSGLQVGLEGAADNLFSSPPRPQPLRVQTLSRKISQAGLPTPGTVHQNKIESKLEKILSASLNLKFQQQMGVFKVSMLEAM